MLCPKGYICETTPDFAYELEYDEELLCFNKSVPICAKVRTENLQICNSKK